MGLSGTVVTTGTSITQMLTCWHQQAKYFRQRRVMEHKKKLMMEGLDKEGAKPIPEGMSLPPRPGDAPQGANSTGRL